MLYSEDMLAVLTSILDGIIRRYFLSIVYIFSIDWQKSRLAIARTYGLSMEQICKYRIFVAKKYKYALNDSFQGCAAIQDTAGN